MSHFTVDRARVSGFRRRADAALDAARRLADRDRELLGEIQRLEAARARAEAGCYGDAYDRYRTRGDEPRAQIGSILSGGDYDPDDDPSLPVSTAIARLEAARAELAPELEAAEAASSHQRALAKRVDDHLRRIGERP